ncbi:hypothetical protein [Bradyrhizobium sp. RDM4]|uniref:hypothetical protein n=1 Tax=Bradyrhizobium sp. RDM4 TaxID=3378765 RepID=UPI0038FC1AAC
MSANEIISIVGGGASVRAIDPARIPGTIIAINDAAIHLPRFDFVVSMDRLWTEYRYERLRLLARPAHIRRAALKNLPDRWPWLTSFECDYTTAVFSEQRGVLNGMNSGQCGFNLAWQLRPAQILLFGFDMQRAADGAAYWYPPYPWSEKGATKNGKYADWARQFERSAKQCAAAGIDVAVVGDSAIKVFRKIPASDFAGVAA